MKSDLIKKQQENFRLLVDANNPDEAMKILEDKSVFTSLEDQETLKKIIENKYYALVNRYIYNFKDKSKIREMRKTTFNNNKDTLYHVVVEAKLKQSYEIIGEMFKIKYYLVLNGNNLTPLYIGIENGFLDVKYFLKNKNTLIDLLNKADKPVREVLNLIAENVKYSKWNFLITKSCVDVTKFIDKTPVNVAIMNDNIDVLEIVKEKILYNQMGSYIYTCIAFNKIDTLYTYFANEAFISADGKTLFDYGIEFKNVNLIIRVMKRYIKSINIIYRYIDIVKNMYEDKFIYILKQIEDPNLNISNQIDKYISERIKHGLVMILDIDGDEEYITDDLFKKLYKAVANEYTNNFVINVNRSIKLKVAYADATQLNIVDNEAAINEAIIPILYKEFLNDSNQHFNLFFKLLIKDEIYKDRLFNLLILNTDLKKFNHSFYEDYINELDDLNELNKIFNIFLTMFLKLRNDQNIDLFSLSSVLYLLIYISYRDIKYASILKSHNISIDMNLCSNCKTKYVDCVEFGCGCIYCITCAKSKKPYEICKSCNRLFG